MSADLETTKNQPKLRQADTNGRTGTTRPISVRSHIIKSSRRFSGPQTLASWIEYRDYRLLWCANFCANLAVWLQLLTVGWLVKDLAEGSSIGGLLVVSVAAINTLPGLAVNPLSGVLGDRLDRRKLMMWVQALGAVLALGFAFLADSEYIRAWHAYAYVLISGAFLAITQPMQQVLVANTVPRESLSNAYAFNVLTITGTRIFGPFVGGLLIFWLGYFWNFAVESALYLSVVLLLLTIRLRYVAPSVEGGPRRFTPFADFKDGVLHIWRRQREIVQMMVLSLIPNTILHPVWFLLPLFTAEVLHADADMGGYLLAITGLGGFISTVTLASFGLPRRKGWIMLLSAAFAAACTMAFAYSSWLPAAFLFLALMSAGQSHYRTIQGTMVLTIVPDQFRARTLSVLAYERGFLTGASILVGVLADATSASMALLVIGGLGLVLSMLCTVSLRRVRELE